VLSSLGSKPFVDPTLIKELTAAFGDLPEKLKTSIKGDEVKDPLNPIVQAIEAQTEKLIGAFQAVNENMANPFPAAFSKMVGVKNFTLPTKPTSPPEHQGIWGSSMQYTPIVDDPYENVTAARRGAPKQAKTLRGKQPASIQQTTAKATAKIAEAHNNLVNTLVGNAMKLQTIRQDGIMLMKEYIAIEKAKAETDALLIATGPTVSVPDTTDDIDELDGSIYKEGFNMMWDGLLSSTMSLSAPLVMLAGHLMGLRDTVKGIGPAIKGLSKEDKLGGFGRLLGKGVAAPFKYLGKVATKSKKGFKAFGKGITDNIKSFRIGGEMLNVITAPMGAFISGMLSPFSALTDLMGGLGEKLGTMFVPLIVKIMEFIMKFMPVLDMIMVAMKPVIDALISLIPPLMGLIPPIMTLVKGLLPPIVDLFMALIPVITQLIPPLIEILNAILPPIITIINLMIVPLTALLQLFSGEITFGDFAAKVWTAIKNALISIFDSFIDLGEIIWDWIVSIFTGDD